MGRRLVGALPPRRQRPHDASATLSALNAGKVGKGGTGERASIALASQDPSLVFVTHDWGGVKLAIRELWHPGERIMGLPVFLRRMCDDAALDPVAAGEVFQLQSGQQPAPTWWASWRAAASGGRSG